MGPDRGDEPIDTQPPGFEVAHPHPTAGSWHRPEGRRDARAARRLLERAVHIEPRDACDPQMKGMRLLTKQPLRITCRAPRGMHRSLRPAHPLTLEERPLDARVADVHEQHGHPQALTVISPEMKRWIPCGVSTISAPRRSMPRAMPRATPSAALTLTARPRSASAARHSFMKGLSPSRSNSTKPR